MKNRRYPWAALAVVLSLASGLAAAQGKPDCDAPKQLEGQVINIDPGSSKLRVRAADGSVHEFQAARETLQEYKVGDSIKAGLRADPRCEKK